MMASSRHLCIHHHVIQVISGDGTGQDDLEAFRRAGQDQHPVQQVGGTAGNGLLLDDEVVSAVAVIEPDGGRCAGGVGIVNAY